MIYDTNLQQALNLSPEILKKTLYSNKRKILFQYDLISTLKFGKLQNAIQLFEIFLGSSRDTDRKYQ